MSYEETLMFRGIVAKGPHAVLIRPRDLNPEEKGNPKYDWRNVKTFAHDFEAIIYFEDVLNHRRPGKAHFDPTVFSMERFRFEPGHPKRSGWKTEVYVDRNGRVRDPRQDAERRKQYEAYKQDFLKERDF